MLRRHWIRAALLALALLVAASWAVSLALEHGWARGSLQARLSASFGRPVEARRFSFSLLGGPRLEADSVTVAEDPRFGQEYFLRADQLTVGFLWSALLRGRIEFGTVSLSHPSLNLVRLPDGAWNVESWLPPANSPAPNLQPAGPRVVTAARHLGRIEIDNGRINFKFGEEKLLFALVGVAGRLDQDKSGRWSLDLRADPMRASVSLQDSGTLRLQGTVAGTSSRLRPAALNLTWEDASLADALRLIGGEDEGVRGLLGAELTAVIKDDGNGAPAPRSDWNISGTLRLSGVHRWDLTARDSDPAVNLSATAEWSPGSPRMDFRRIVLQAPHSQLVAGAALDWERGIVPSLEIASSNLSLEDLLAWRRAFHSDSSDGVTLDGFIGLQAKLAGWPPQIEQASLGGSGAVVHLASLAPPILIGPISAALHKDSFVLDPIMVSFPGIRDAAARGKQQFADQPAVAPVGTVRVQGDIGPFRPGSGPRNWHYSFALSGQTARLQDFEPLADTLGHPLSKDWTIEGPASMQLTWAGDIRRGAGTLTGALDLHGLQVTGALLNQPLLLSSAEIELQPAGWHVKLNEARAFGGKWKGTLDRVRGGAWQFDLSAGRLDVADLDRWLGPRARPGFLQRMFGSTGSPPPREELLGSLGASGRLRIAELLLAPLHVEKLDAAAELHGRTLTLRRAQAEFFDGHVSGEFDAELAATPSYSFRGEFEKFSLAQLAAAVPPLEERLAGQASGDLTLEARGIGKDQLVSSLSGEGKMQVREPLIRGLALAPSALGVREGKSGGDEHYSTAVANFHVSGKRLRLDDLLLAGREGHFELQGTVDFAQKLDLRAWTLSQGADFSLDSARNAERSEWSVVGTLAAPQLVRQTHIAGNSENSAAPIAGISSGAAASRH